MAGFCPFDTAYLEKPSIVFGGWIAFLAARAGADQVGRTTVDFIPSTNNVLSHYVKEFDSLEEATRQLKSEHVDGVHVYRGQTGRHNYRVEGNVRDLQKALGTVGPLCFRLESLLPSFARRLIGSPPSQVIDWSRWLPIGRLDHAASAIRATSVSNDVRLRELVAHACRDTFDQSVLAGIQSQMVNVPMLSDVRAIGQSDEASPHANIPESFAKLIALAQHYGYPTCMVDVTRSIQVASWFASHNWATGELHPPDGQGVIYRVSPRKLVDLIEHQLFKDRAFAGERTELGVFGYVDLADFGSFCPRVRAQEGGSLFGLESAMVTALAFGHEAIELFTFPHAHTTGAETVLHAEDLRPLDDPLIHTFGDAHRDVNDVLSWSELEPVLRQGEVNEVRLAIYRNQWMHGMARLLRKQNPG